ncbi:MAG TPA: ElyC/SanA/YdcF family protein [Verrucomicrobiae bacterium]|jgi:hypothetical protein
MKPGFWGLFVRKERWGLSWRGWLVSVVAVLLVGFFVFFEIHPFLAVTHRENSNVLVVEGWVHEYATIAAVREFNDGHYQQVYTTGGPVDGLPEYVNDFQTSASVGADLLKKDGLSDHLIQMVPSHVMDRDRTYSSAVALRNWFHDHNVSVQSFNVLTEDAHARRTWLLFQEAFGKDVKVGIISIPDPGYDATHWWRYSEGVRDMIGEGLAYLYAKFFFWPKS